MDRRTFLSAASVCVAGVAGCGSADSSPTETPSTSPTQTRTATETPTPTRTPPEQRYRPQLLDAALVSTWSEPGDLTANRVRTVRRGQPAVFAFRYRIRIPEGTINLKEGVDVVHEDELVVRRFRDTDRDVDSAGLHTWEDAMTFETAEWPTGELTATVAVGELQLHRTSDGVSTTFEVTSA